jgi:CopG family nickel-responsive transcriptional regulator
MEMVVKTGVALPDEVHRRLVELVRALGYTSVSKAIRDAIDLFIAFNRWWLERGNVMGTLQAVAASHEGLEGVSRLEAVHSDIVTASLRVKAGDHTLIVLVVKGPGSKVKKLYTDLLKVRGVVAVQPSLLPAP